MERASGRKEDEIAGGLIHDRATPTKGSSALLPVRWIFNGKTDVQGASVCLSDHASNASDLRCLRLACTYTLFLSYHRLLIVPIFSTGRFSRSKIRIFVEDGEEGSGRHERWLEKRRKIGDAGRERGLNKKRRKRIGETERRDGEAR